MNGRFNQEGEERKKFEYRSIEMIFSLWLLGLNKVKQSLGELWDSIKMYHPMYCQEFWQEYGTERSNECKLTKLEQ